MTSTVKRIYSKKEYIIEAGFSERDFEFMIGMLRRYSDEFPCHQPVLCHGDFVPEHIFITDDMGLSSVIDFGQFQGGSPILDFIHLTFVQPELDLNPLKRNYPDRQMIEHSFDLRLYFHKLMFLIECVAYVTKVRNPEADKTPDALYQLKKTLDVLAK